MRVKYIHGIVPSATKLPYSTTFQRSNLFQVQLQLQCSFRDHCLLLSCLRPTPALNPPPVYLYTSSAALLSAVMTLGREQERHGGLSTLCVPPYQQSLSHFFKGHKTLPSTQTFQGRWRESLSRSRSDLLVSGWEGSLGLRRPWVSTLSGMRLCPVAGPASCCPCSTLPRGS